MNTAFGVSFPQGGDRFLRGLSSGTNASPMASTGLGLTVTAAEAWGAQPCVIAVGFDNGAVAGELGGVSSRWPPWLV